MAAPRIKHGGLAWPRYALGVGQPVTRLASTFAGLGRSDLSPNRRPWSRQPSCHLDRAYASPRVCADGDRPGTQRTRMGPARPAPRRSPPSRPRASGRPARARPGISICAVPLRGKSGYRVPRVSAVPTPIDGRHSGRSSLTHSNDEGQAYGKEGAEAQYGSGQREAAG